MASGFARESLYLRLFCAAILNRPSSNEQLLIAQDVENQVKTLSSQLGVIDREIQLLHEYHALLIADVVTGKLDVRAFVQARLSTLEKDLQSWQAANLTMMISLIVMTNWRISPLGNPNEPSPGQSQDLPHHTH